MRGYPNWNFPAFDEAERRWREAGHVAFSPAQTDRALGYGPTTDDGMDREHLRHVMLSDIACLYHADAIALLPGWENSAGSTVELALAHFLGLKIYCAETFKELNVMKTPWEFHRQVMTKTLNDISNEIHKLGE